MSKIYLSGDRVVDASKVEAERIEHDWSNKVEFIKINDSITVKNREIKRIEKRGDSTRNKYDLNNLSDKQIIRDFESMLASIESNATDPPYDLSWYGHILKSRGGWVNNEILGAVHWSTVQYAIDQRLICRLEKQYISWAIVNEGDERTPRCGAFNDFKAKLDALAELRSRRSYAEQKEAEGQAEVIEQEVRMFEQRTLMPKVERPSRYNSEDAVMDQETAAGELPL